MSFPILAELGKLTRTLVLLGELAPERMTLSQSVFFLAAARENLAGRECTFGSIRDELGSNLNRSLHTTYKILLEPSHSFPKGLGWLKAELNPLDNRQKFLCLTSDGKAVIDKVLQAMAGNS